MNDQSAQPTRTDFTPVRFAMLLALLVVATYPQVVFGIETFVARDFGFFAYPLAYFQRTCFWHGELPFWDPYNNCGVPCLAQWNTMPLYPPALIYLILPLHWSLSAFSLAHLWFAGLGMYFLARRWTNNPMAASFAGSVFAFNGFTLNLLMWPSHIATFSWMPWVVLAVEKAWREGGKKIPCAALAGAMQMLAGGPETIFITWLILVALWLHQFAKGDVSRACMGWRFPLVVFWVIALSAAQLFPFLDLVAHAQRATGYTDLRWSMPATGLANFLVPVAFGSTATEGIFFQHGQYWTSSYYVGMGALWLAVLAPAFTRGRRVGLLATIAGIALLCALGEHTPFYPLLRKLVPQLSFITYPVKYVMVVIFAAPLLAAIALSDWDKIRKPLLPMGAGLLVLIGGIIVWTQFTHDPNDNPHATLMNGLSRVAFLILTGAILFALARGKASPLLRYLPLVLILVAWLDVFTHEPRQNPTVSPNIYELNLARTALAMNPQPDLGQSRAMLSPDAALELTIIAGRDSKANFLAKRTGYCADANLLDGVPKVDGFFSLTPREFDSLLSLINNATNGKWTALEAFMGVSQYTSTTNILAWEPRTNSLPLVSAGQKPVFLDDTNTLWTFGRNDFDPSSTVYLPPESRALLTVTNGSPAKIMWSKFGNRTVDFQIAAPALVLAVVSQTYYHDWRAEVDGQAVPLLRANVAFQAVQVPAGMHRVHLYYKDRAFEIGAGLSGCALGACVIGGFAWRRRTT